MWQYLQHLAVQQTTPAELATFLVVVTVACIAVAGVIYLGIMTGAWILRLRRQHRWREVVFPDLALRKRFSWEYALAALTSIVLTLTLGVKDQIVDRVLELPAEQFIDQHLVASAFPLHRLPSAGDLGGRTSLREEVEQLPSLTLGGLARGPLEAGRSGELRPVFLAAVREVLNRQVSLAARLTRWLTLVSVVLILVYLVWLSRRRINELKAATKNVDSPYERVMGRLSVLGVCLALLLATPLITSDADLLADSAVAAARRAPPKEETRRLDSLVVIGIERQNELLATGVKPDTYGRSFLALTGRLDSLAMRVGQIESAFSVRLRAVLDSMAQRTAASDPATRLSAHERAIAALEQRFVAFDRLGQDVQALQKQLDALGNRALLLVETETGQAIIVRAPQSGPARVGGRAARVATRAIATDTTVSLRWLAPGTYQVDVPGIGRREQVVLGTGQAVAISIRAVIR